MKWLFLFMLVGNVVYVGWEVDRQTRLDFTNAASLPSIPAGAERLRFLSELDSLPPVRNVELEDPLANIPVVEAGGDAVSDETDSDPDAAGSLLSIPDFTEETVETAPSACFSFGPIADENQASSLQNWFAAYGGRASTRHLDEQGRQLFWIYLAPEESRQQAMDTIRDFRDKGIVDYRLIVKGNLQNAISMGLFSSQASVNKRLGELKEKGYKPVVVPYSDGKRVYWVDAHLPGDQAGLDRVFSDYPSRFSSVPVNCEEIAMPGEYS